MGSKIKSWLKANYLICILALLVGTIMIAPHIYFMYTLGEDYHGIYMLESDAELHYLARVHEFVDGNSYGSPYIYDFKDNVPTTFLTLGEGLLAIPSIIFGISVTDMNLIYKFILPILLTFLIYGFARRIGLDKKYSIAATSLIILGHALMYVPSLIAFLKLEQIAQQFTLYARPINPQLSSIFFFGYLHVLMSALELKKWKGFILTGLLLGAVFYIYFYAYVFMTTFSVLLLMILMLLKQKDLALKMLTSILIGLAIGIPAIKALIDMQTHPFFAELAQTLTVTSTHKPVIGISYVIVFTVFLICFLKSNSAGKRSDSCAILSSCFAERNSFKNPKLYILLTLICTMFAVTNQQVITGREVHLGHFIWYYGGPILTLIILFLISRLFKDKKYLNSALVGFFIFLAISSSIFSQYSSYEFWEKDYITRQDYAVVFDWINQNTELESAVFANETLSDFIPVYTGANIAWANHYARSYLLPNNNDYFSMDYLLENNFETPYRLDYVVWDKQENPDWEIKVGELVYEDQRFNIYDMTTSNIKTPIS